MFVRIRSSGEVGLWLDDTVLVPVASGPQVGLDKEGKLVQGPSQRGLVPAGTVVIGKNIVLVPLADLEVLSEAEMGGIGLVRVDDEQGPTDES